MGVTFPPDMELSEPMRLGGGWSPQNLIDISAWFDGQDAGTLFQDSGLTTPSGAGDVVGGWRDKANNYNLTQPTTANKPTLTASAINGYAAPYFVTDDWMINTALGALFSGSDVPISLWFVIKQDNIATRQNPWVIGSSSSDTPNMSMLLWETGTRYLISRRDDTSAAASPLGGTNDTDPHVIGVVFPGTTITLYEDGVTIINAGACDVGTMTVDQFVIGALKRASLSLPLDGYIGEMVVVSRAVTSSEAGQLDTFLSAKWGITLP